MQQFLLFFFYFLKVFLFISGTSNSCLIIISLISIKEPWQLQNSWGKKGGVWGSEEAGGERKPGLCTWLRVLREPLGWHSQEGLLLGRMAAQALGILFRRHPECSHKMGWNDSVYRADFLLLIIIFFFRNPIADADTFISSHVPCNLGLHVLLAAVVS